MIPLIDYLTLSYLAFWDQERMKIVEVVERRIVREFGAVERRARSEVQSEIRVSMQR